MLISVEEEEGQGGGRNREGGDSRGASKAEGRKGSKEGGQGCCCLGIWVLAVFFGSVDMVFVSLISHHLKFLDATLCNFAFTTSYCYLRA
jgi:hypothetical protein